jgi:ribosomal protein L44E
MLSGKNTGAYVAAGIMLFLGIMILLGGATGGAVMVVWGISYFVGGALTVFLVRKGRKDADRFRRYIDIIVNSGERNIDVIAGYMEISYDSVVKDLEEMIKLEFFRGAVIDKINRQVKLREQYTDGQQQPQQQLQQQPQQQQQMTVVRCANCGANNTVPAGRVSECEYCGAPLAA